MNGELVWGRGVGEWGEMIQNMDHPRSFASAAWRVGLRHAGPAPAARNVKYAISSSHMLG